MLHYLTVGFLDVSAVLRREIRTTSPLSEPVRLLLSKYLDGGAKPEMEGSPVDVTESYVKCPWGGSAERIRTAERFAVAAMTAGCVVADIEHGRIVTLAELTTTEAGT